MFCNTMLSITNGYICIRAVNHVCQPCGLNVIATMHRVHKHVFNHILNVTYQQPVTKLLHIYTHDEHENVKD